MSTGRPSRAELDRAPRVGVVGLGFMGRMHVAAYRLAAEAGCANELVAVCDPDPKKRSGRSATRGNLGTGGELLFDPAAVAAYAQAGELFAHDGLDAVSLCTPTDTHVPLALEALERGLHVLVEKPVALAPEDARRLAEAARASGRTCMPALCMRFWPGWQWLRERVRAGTFGAVRSAVFRRLGSPPAWGREFYGDVERCGGALFDLHVHDADFVRWCFGPPAAVTSTGTPDHATTLYHYPDGPPHVVAEGGWDHAPGWRFRMQFTVVFEAATVDYGGYDESPLVLVRDGTVEPVPLEHEDGYAAEIRHFLRVLRGDATLAVTADEAVGLTEMLAAERRSLERGERVALGPESAVRG